MAASRGNAIDLSQGYNNFLRKEEKARRGKSTPCPICKHEFGADTTRDDIRRHVIDEHDTAIQAEDKDVNTFAENIYTKLTTPRPSGNQQSAYREQDTEPRLAQTGSVAPNTSISLPDPIGGKRVSKGPSSIKSLKRDKDVDDKASHSKRSRARAPLRTSGSQQGLRTADQEFRRDATQKGRKLWTPDGPPSPRRAESRQATDSSRQSNPRTFEPPSPQIDDVEALMKQPETRPITQEQLVAEVKGIYAGLVMVESKCIEVDNSQSSSTSDTGPRLKDEQWQALIALHRTLLHEHHDFFLASQHPSASPALRRLASKYAMPARMWRHGIHSFLELLRHRLPASIEHMLTFIYLAYSMMALLYETVPTFEDTWIECLGDLGRYRMAIEDENLKDREVWTSVSRHWYSMASDQAPTTGRLYHHLAILARPNALQQLFYYTKSLCVPIPFISARESIMTLFEPHLNGSPTRLLEIDASFVRAHGVLFSGRNPEQFTSSVDEFIAGLDNHISRTTRRWMDNGCHIGIALGCAVLEYGSESNLIMRAIKAARADDADVQMEGTVHTPSQKFQDALDFMIRTHKVVFRRFGDTNITPYLHVTLTFLFHMSHFPTAMVHIEKDLPWKLICLFLNTLLDLCSSFEKIESEKFPRPDKDTPRPLPDDYAQRGLLWVDQYYPNDWFTAAQIDEEEKYLEVPSMTEERQDRCLWLGCRLAQSGKWLTYDKDTRKFGVPSEYDVEIPDLPMASVKDSSSTDVDIPDAPIAAS